MVQSLASIASGHDLMPPYSNTGTGPYHRTLQNLPYPQLETKFSYPQVDAKPAYGSEWTAVYGDETSPIDNYSFDSSSTYLTSPPTPAGSNLCGLSYRCTPQFTSARQATTSYNSDYGHSYISSSLPYLQTDIPPAATTEPTSPLNMSSLQLTLPDRPRQRQVQPTEISSATRRQLPAPQPKPGHGLHHALDHQQDQRLRSSQTAGTPLYSSSTSSYANAGSFARPLLPWTAANENLMNVVNEAASTAMPSTLPRVSVTASNSSPPFFPAGSSPNDTPSTTSTTSPNELNFGTLPLLDPSTMTAPTPPSYSNFRESRDIPVSMTATRLPRHNSSSSLYTFDSVSRQPSFPGTSSTSNLISGHRYTPLNQSTDTSSVDTFSKESFESRSVPLHRASTSNLSSNF